MKEKKALLVILGLLIFGTCMNTPGVYAYRAEITVAAGSSNGNVYVYNGVGNLLWSYSTGADVASVAVSFYGTYVAVGSLGNALYLFTKSGTKLWEKTVPIAYGGAGRGEESKAVAISDLAEYVVAGCTDALRVYRKNGMLHWSHTGKETCVGISPNGNYIVACEKNGDIHLFSTASGTPLWTKSISAFWVATNNRGYVIASTSSKTYLFNVAGTQLWSYTLDRGTYVRVDMPWVGLTSVAANDDAGNVACYLWHFDKTGLHWKRTPCPPEHDFYSVAISADSNFIATGPGPMGGIYIYSADGTLIQSITTGTFMDIHSVDLTCNGQFGAAGDHDGILWYFSKDSSTPLWSKTIGGDVHAVALADWQTGGGIWVPVDKIGLLAPYLDLVSTIVVATVSTAIYVKCVRRRKEK